MKNKELNCAAKEQRESERVKNESAVEKKVLVYMIRCTHREQTGFICLYSETISLRPVENKWRVTEYIGITYNLCYLFVTLGGQGAEIKYMDSMELENNSYLVICRVIVANTL